MKVVYIDVVWLTNFCMDAVILLAAAWMARRRVRWWKIAFGSVLGASYALLLLAPQAMEPAISMVAKIAFSCLMVIVTFGPKNVLEFLRFWGLFYLASFVVGGAAYALNALSGQTQMFGGMVLVAGKGLWDLNITNLAVITAVPVVYILGKIAWKRLQRLKNREGNLWQVQIRIDDFTAEFTGLLDTGNALSDPISGLPVAVVEWQALEPVLPPVLIAAYKENRDVTMELSGQGLDPDWQSRLRIIPYRGVGGSMGMLLAFRPTHFVMRQGDEQLNTTKLLVAINPKPMAADKTYQAILPPACLTDTHSSIAS